MKISIITVCMNSVKTLERTIQSVLRQSYDDLEYIVIDGGSTDGTIEIIEKYEEALSYWVSERDEGLYDAMNKGFEKSTGEIIAFLNSDDWYEENTLSKVNSYFRQCNPMILSGKINTLQKGKWTKYKGNLECDKENIHMAMIYRQPATFVRREIFYLIGRFNTRYKIAADFEWMLKAHNAGVEIVEVEDVFTNFSSSGISHINMDLSIREAREVALEALDKCDKYTRQEKEEWRRKIRSCYDEQQATAEIKNIIRNRQLSDYPKLKASMLSYFTEQSYIVWGIGIIGDDIYNLLMQLGLKVDYFVDKKAENTVQKFHRRQVLSPQELVYGKKIIVASFEYEDEIADQLEKMKFREERDYILYSRISLKLIETYRECYLKYKYQDYNMAYNQG